jgi:phytoene dehydrogenase-like protein
MPYDVIVIGAGIGGLLSAAKLARKRKKVLVLEKLPHIGGTSFIFRRGGYTFPMGPLAFSFPQRVKSFLAEAGVTAEIGFRRNHFQLLTPSFDIIYSHPLEELKEELKKVFPEEADGIDAFLTEMEKLIEFFKDRDEWHPDYLLGRKREAVLRDQSRTRRQLREFVNMYSDLPSTEILDKHFKTAALKSLLGSQGTTPPEMSLLHLADMWNVMSEVGIWSPSCRIHGLSELLAEVLITNGGEIRLTSPVEKILVDGERVTGVRTARGEIYKSQWVVSNADPKRTFLEFMEPSSVPLNYLELIREIPYTRSELCVYLGLDPAGLDLSKMRAAHLFYREVEICLWSENAPDSVPPGRVSVILRAGFAYDLFEDWRTGERKRKDGYKEHKLHLAKKLIQTVEGVLPGLASAVEVMEVATPLTYQDWGQRYRGSVAGWTWSAELAANLPGKLLVQTPIPNLLMVGIYAATQLFLGGVPTSMHTASLAANLILEN